MKYQKNYYLLSPSFYNPSAFQDVKFVVLFWNMKPVWADFNSFHKYCDRKYLPMLLNLGSREQAVGNRGVRKWGRSKHKNN